MTIDRKLLEILVCPVTKLSLSMLSDEKLSQLNEKIAQGTLNSMDGEPVSTALEEALITANGNIIYPIEASIPVMLEERSISILELEGS